MERLFQLTAVEQRGEFSPYYVFCHRSRRMRKCIPSKTVASDFAMSTIALPLLAEDVPLARGAIATPIS